MLQTVSAEFIQSLVMIWRIVFIKKKAESCDTVPLTCSNYCLLSDFDLKSEAATSRESSHLRFGLTHSVSCCLARFHFTNAEQGCQLLAYDFGKKKPEKNRPLAQNVSRTQSHFIEAVLQKTSAAKEYQKVEYITLYVCN
jgi:hypothetical protein